MSSSKNGLNELCLRRVPIGSPAPHLCGWAAEAGTGAPGGLHAEPVSNSISPALGRYKPWGRGMWETRAWGTELSRCMRRPTTYPASWSSPTAATGLSLLPVGLFRAGTGAAAAVSAAVFCSERVAALVSQGGSDVDVLELNIWAAAHLQARHHLKVVPGATQTRDWFVDNLMPSPSPG